MSICAAGIKLTNERLCLSAPHLQLWRALGALLLMIPLVLALHLRPPSDPAFYCYVGLNGLIVAYTDIQLINGVRGDRFGAGVIARLRPLSFVGTFVLWFAVEPALLMRYRAHPALALGVLTCLGAICCGALGYAA
jgi:hypothetical protein